MLLVAFFSFVFPVFLFLPGLFLLLITDPADNSDDRARILFIILNHIPAGIITILFGGGLSFIACISLRKVAVLIVPYLIALVFLIIIGCKVWSA